jgi:hypothetical protein
MSIIGSILGKISDYVAKSNSKSHKESCGKGRARRSRLRFPSRSPVASSDRWGFLCIGLPIAARMPPEVVVGTRRIKATEVIGLLLLIAVPGAPQHVRENGKSFYLIV